MKSINYLPNPKPRAHKWQYSPVQLALCIFNIKALTYQAVLIISELSDDLEVRPEYLLLIAAGKYISDKGCFRANHMKIQSKGELSINISIFPVEEICIKRVGEQYIHILLFLYII